MSEDMSRRTYLVCCYNYRNIKGIMDSIKKQDGYFVAVLLVPYWSPTGRVVSEQYAIVYQAVKELDIKERDIEALRCA